MTYRRAPERRKADKWHALLNNGHHYALIDDTGKVIAAGHTEHAPAIKANRRHRPTLKLINVDEQIK